MKSERWNFSRNLRNVQDLVEDGETPYERRFGNPLKGQQHPDPNQFDINQEFITLTRKFYQEFTSDVHWLHGEFGKKILRLQILKNSKRWTHWKVFHRIIINAKEVLNI